MTAPSAVPAPRWITYVRLNELRPAVRNPKKHDLPALVESIERHGFTSPIVICSRTDTIAAGHGRLGALIHMRSTYSGTPSGLVLDDDGEWCVPVLRGWSSRNDAELEAYIIADNRLTEAGGWDEKVLVEMMHDLNAVDPALFDGLGYTADELDDLFRRVDPERLDADPSALPSGMGAGGEGDDFGGGRPAAGALIECPKCSHLFTPQRGD